MSSADRKKMNHARSMIRMFRTILKYIKGNNSKESDKV